MKHHKRRLQLNRDTVAVLTGDQTRRVLGGRDKPVTTSTITIITWDCPGVTDTTCFH